MVRLNGDLENEFLADVGDIGAIHRLVQDVHADGRYDRGRVHDGRNHRR